MSGNYRFYTNGEVQCTSIALKGNLEKKTSNWILN